MMKSKQKIQFFLFTLFISTFFMVSGHIVRAEGNTAKVPFQYKVVFPENQVSSEIGYYHLIMKSGQEQVVNIEFTNPGKEKTAIGISLNSAKTNSNGVIEYGDTKIKNDKSLKFDFKKVVSTPERIELKPGETKKLDVSIKMPETSFDGVIVGGIQLIQEDQNNVEDMGGSMVLNEYAYTIGMVLQESEKK